MVSYGTLSAWEKKQQELNGGGLKKPSRGPIFLENPDGTITEAVPSELNAKLAKKPQVPPSEQESEATDGVATIVQEVEFLYSRHERILIFLLVVQLTVEFLYIYVYLAHMADGTSVAEFLSMYGWRVRPDAAARLLWAVLVLQVLYNVVYYLTAGIAIWTQRPKHYRLLANVGMYGIVMLVLFAYVDKFNLLLFFLHLLTFIYARFLQGLTSSLLLLPPVGPLAAV